MAVGVGGGVWVGVTDGVNVGVGYLVGDGVIVINVIGIVGVGVFLAFFKVGVGAQDFLSTTEKVQSPGITSICWLPHKRDSKQASVTL